MPPMLNWQRAETLLAETVREIGVLFFVFAPLEAVFADAPISEAVVVAMFLFGSLLIAGGIIVGARR